MNKTLICHFIMFFLIVQQVMFADSCQDLLRALKEKKKYEAIKLIKESDNLECRNEKGYTPLLFVTWRWPGWFKNDEVLEIVKLLLEKGANPNARLIADLDDMPHFDELIGSTALINAAGYGMQDVVSILLEYGADIDAKNIFGRTAVMYAAFLGNFEMVKFLIEKGANLNLKTNQGENVLLYAVGHSSREKYEIVKLLVEKGLDVNCKDNDGWTPLIQAVIWEQYKTVKFLIEKGANINDRNSDGQSALMFACTGKNNSKEIVKILLEAGADVSFKDKDGKSAYFYALEWGNFEVAEMVAMAGAPTTPNNKICKRILKKAVKNGYKPKVK